ncbi:MAG: hypothetical protein WDZ90_02910 [Candidatus Paceibacterota bacterium]
MKRFRTRLGKDIVCEVAEPSRPSKRGIIFLDGMPTVPSKRAFLDEFARSGFWVFHPRYRGTWESSGLFLRESPEEDVYEVLNSVSKGFWDIASNEKVIPEIKEWSLVGGSFGGPAALLASRDKRVSRVIAIAPVVDWSELGHAEPIDWLYGFVKEAFGEGYRLKKKDWNKLKKGNFYNPIQCVDDIPGEKIWIIQARDDDSVRFGPVKKFAKKIGAKFTLYKRGGHLGSKVLLHLSRFSRAKDFLKGK